MQGGKRRTLYIKHKTQSAEQLALQPTIDEEETTTKSGCRLEERILSSSPTLERVWYRPAVGCGHNTVAVGNDAHF